MKIALVSPYDYNHPGGVSSHIGHLRAEFLTRGHDVTILSPRGRKGGMEERPGFYGVGRTVAIPTNGSMARVTFDVTLFAAVKAILKREQFDVVHVHEPLAPLLPYMVLLNSPGANVGTFHAFRSSSALYSTFKPYMNLLMARLTSRIAVSAPALDFISQYFDGDYQIVPNGIDVHHFAGGEPFAWADDGRPRILFVGRFSEPRKGFKYLLRAMPLVQQQFPDAQLVVAGAGRPEKFAGIIERYRVRNVEFAGMVSIDDLARYYASCDVFCAPSIARESFGIVLLEAMAAGKPVVAGDNPGYASVMTNGREGLLAPPKDAQSLALALVRLLSSASLRRTMGDAGRITAARYAWPRIAADVLDVYGRAIGASNPRSVRSRSE